MTMILRAPFELEPEQTKDVEADGPCQLDGSIAQVIFQIARPLDTPGPGTRDLSVHEMMTTGTRYCLVKPNGLDLHAELLERIRLELRIMPGERVMMRLESRRRELVRGQVLFVVHQGQPEIASMSLSLVPQFGRRR